MAVRPKKFLLEQCIAALLLYARSMPAPFSLDKTITFRLKVVYRVNGYTPRPRAAPDGASGRDDSSKG
jgi:hypothetical protein